MGVAERVAREVSALDDAVWRALADKTRRSILDLLRAGPRTSGSLSAEFPLTRFAIMKHLTILEGAGLVVVERKGRERINHLNPVPIQAVYRRWIRPFERLPADRMLRLRDVAEAAGSRPKKRRRGK